MIHWLRLVFSVFALAGLLAAGTGEAYAKKAQLHHCAGMTTEGAGGDAHRTVPACCAVASFVFVQPALSSHEPLLPPSVAAELQQPLRDDDHGPSLTAAPDLRPPIA